MLAFIRDHIDQQLYQLYERASSSSTFRAGFSLL